LSVIRFESDRFLKLADRRGDFALRGKRDAEIVVGFGVIRAEAERLLELADLLVNLPFPDERVAELVVGVGVSRLPAEGFLELRDRRLNLSLLVEGSPQVQNTASAGFQPDPNLNTI
jgi:hypothetical protein